MITLMNGDCLLCMDDIETNSIDLVLTDLPYGTTVCRWDSIIPMGPMWDQLKRIVKLNGVIALFGQEPFSSLLRCSNLPYFKYDWYWRKSRPSGFVNAKLKPLKNIEIISIFSEGTMANGSKRNMPYFPQGLKDCNVHWSRPQRYHAGDKGVNPTRKAHTLTKRILKSGYPRQVLDFSNPNRNLYHPTQKPVDLLEYFIKTYTLEGERVLDFTMGSGSTMVAAKRLNRDGIGIDSDSAYYEIAQKRLDMVSPGIGLNE